MITSLILALALAQTAQTPQNPAPSPQQSASQQGAQPATHPSGAAMISKMFAYYASATSMVGTIRLTQQAESQAISLETDLAYESPSKIYLKQVLTGANSRVWLITSDGKVFTYDYPNKVRDASDRPESGRLMEAVSPDRTTHQTYKQIFRASIFSLGDLSIPVLLSIAGNDELQAIKDEIATVQYLGTDKLGGQTVNVLGGAWKAGPKDKPSAQYKMYITDDGQLKRYVQVDIISLKMRSAQLSPHEVVSTWDVDLHANAKPDESIFKVVRTGN